MSDKKTTKRPSPKKPEPQPATSDLSRAEAAFKHVAPRLSSLTAVLTPNTDIKGAASVALAVAKRVSEPSLRARFESLPKAEFDAAQIADLPTVAWAAWYASNELDKHRATTSEAKLPSSPWISRPRLGSVRLRRALPAARRGHRGGHQALSRRGLATRARRRTRDDRTLGRSDDARGQSLHRVYEDVAATGRWLHRNEPQQQAELFPSLIAASRPSPRRAPGGEAPSPAPSPVKESVEEGKGGG